VSLSCQASPGATSYNVYRGTTSGGPYTEIAVGVTNAYTDTAVTDGTRYYYVVTANNGTSESLYSPEANATPYVPYAGSPVLINADFGSGATQTGAAVLGSAGNTWNAVSGSTGTIVNSGGSTVSGVGLNLGAYGVYTDTGGTAMDAATTPLMQDYAFGYSSTPTVTVSITGLTAYAGANYTLVIYAAGDNSGQGATLNVTSGASGGNTGSTLSTTATSRQVSAGAGVAYTTFTGTINGGTLTFTANILSGQSFTDVNGFQLYLTAP
jgi:cellulose 1,4-beta-cellobiosidase